MQSTFASTALQARAQATALGHRLHFAFGGGRTMTATIVAFMVLYMAVAYLLVSKGLEYIYRLPLMGQLLTERMLFLLFFFFLVMLVLSNAAITGLSLFRRQETGWQLSLPIPHSSIVVWRTIEGLLVSSWGLLLLSAPIMAAFGQTWEAGFGFYAASLPAILCLIVVASNVSSWLLMVVVRFYKPWWLKAAGVILTVLVVYVVYQLQQGRSSQFVGGDVQANVNQILRHTQLASHPLLPSSWAAEAVIASARDAPTRTVFFTLTLLSYATAAWLVTVALARTFFYGAWNRALQRAEQNRPKDQTHLFGDRGRGWGSVLRRRLGLGRNTAALVLKDCRTFLREPMQWGQCALIFGLLLLYTSNLRHLGYNYRDNFWSGIIGFLNLTVCCLALSTLTTRFVFPQFSMEGQRLWILGLAPFHLSKVLRVKLLLNLTATIPVMTLLVGVSCRSLNHGWHRSAFFISAILMLTIGLNSLAMSLGTLLPNFRETNSAKIVSGFGGTICLVSSFFYIVVCILALVMPTVVSRTRDLTVEKVQQWELASLGAVFIITVIIGGVPYIFANRKTKKLANLGNP